MGKDQKCYEQVKPEVIILQFERSHVHTSRKKSNWKFKLSKEMYCLHWWHTPSKYYHMHDFWFISSQQEKPEFSHATVIFIFSWDHQNWDEWVKLHRASITHTKKFKRFYQHHVYQKNQLKGGPQEKNQKWARKYRKCAVRPDRTKTHKPVRRVIHSVITVSLNL